MSALPALFAAALALSPALRAQQFRDPVAASGGGGWLRAAGDPWCVLGAPALLPLVRGWAAGAVHQPSPWGLPELSATGAAAAGRVGGGGAGVAVFRSGFDLYTETVLGAGYGAVAGPVLWGVGARVTRVAIARYGSRWIPAADIAVAVRSEIADLGLRFSGPGGADGGVEGTSGSLALLLRPSGVAWLSLEGGRDDVGDFSANAGAGWDDGGPLALRVGASSSFTRIHCGAEVRLSRRSFGYGVTIHPDLGWNHAFWVTVGWGG